MRLYTPYLIDAVDLLPNVAYPQFFPIDFDVEVSSDGDTWAAVGGQRNAAVGPTDKVRVAFPPTLAAAVRLRVVRAYVHPSGLAYASIAEMSIQEASSASDTLRVTFTAPGDDPGVGRAQSYDLRRATAPLTAANFAAATAIPTTAPLSAGAPESIDVAGLAGQTTYYFGIKAPDEAGHVSPLSNIASAATLIVPPSTITDLIAPGRGSRAHVARTSTLAWTAPGADGKTGQASSYDLRQSAAPLTAGGFDAATPITHGTSAARRGTRETSRSLGSTGAKSTTALRAVDEKGAVGGVSNIVVAPVDGTDVGAAGARSVIGGRSSNLGVKLTAQIDSVSDQLSSQRAPTNLIDGDVATAWVSQAASPTTPAWVILDYGTPQPLNRFRTNPSTLIWSAATHRTSRSRPASTSWPGLRRSRRGADRHLRRVERVDRAGHLRALRAPLHHAARAGGRHRCLRGDGRIRSLRHGAVDRRRPDLIAPGDDGYAGTAARYDLRQSAVPIDDTSFASATQLSTLPPLHGGMIEVHHLAALPAETKLYFDQFDSDGNTGPLSNIATLTTPGVAPAPVADFAVTGATPTSLSLSFTATGDDGVIGRATAYELRYAKTPIAAATWASAAIAPTPAPQNPGTRETVTVAGLDPTSVYYFAIKVIDDVGNTSPMSNLASGSTLDGTAPARVTDLVAATVDPTQRPALALTVTDSSGSYSPETAAANLLDANAATVWISPGTATVQPMSVTFDLGGARKLGRLRLRAGVGYVDLFPPDFRLEVQATAGGTWKTVVAETGITTAGDWEEWLLGAVAHAVAARLDRHQDRALEWQALHRARRRRALRRPDRLQHAAPVLDRARRRRHDRHRQAVRRAARAAADRQRRLRDGDADRRLTRAAPGRLPRERFDVTGLPAETATCFALTAIDKGAATSRWCRIPAARPRPGCRRRRSPIWRSPAPPPPPRRADLHRAGRRRDHRHGGQATSCAARPRASPAPTGARRRSWAVCPHRTRPGPRRRSPRPVLRARPSITLPCARSTPGGNAGAFSNDARGTTADNVPPASVTDLSAATVSAQGGSLALSWTAPGDSGLAGTAQRYDVRISTAPITAGNFASATSVAVGAPQAPGTHETATVSGLPAESLILASRSKPSTPPAMSHRCRTSRRRARATRRRPRSLTPP